MNIRQLNIFRTVCEEMSFTRAAERLFMTQPAVSHVISDLEREAGTALFERRGRRIVLNLRGELLLEKALRLLEFYEDVERSLSGIEERAGLRLGSSITIAGFWLPGLIKEFERDCVAPLSVQVDSAKNTARYLREGAVDIALIEGGSYLEDFEYFTFSSYPVIPLGAPDYLEQQLGIGKAGRGMGYHAVVEVFAGMRLLLREEGSAIRDVLEGAFLQRELKLTPFWTSVNSQALLRAAEEGMGVTVLPEILAKEAMERGTLVELEVEGLRLSNENHVAFCRDTYLTGPMRRFIELVKKKCDSQKFH